MTTAIGKDENMTTATEEKINVWVGCLACYNEGRLTGEWVEALRATEFTPCTRPGHEEWWVFDTDTQWIKGECSPSEAQEIAEAVQELPEYIDVDAVQAYLEYEGTSLTDLDLSDFEDRYQGAYDSVSAFIEDLWESCDYDSELPEWVRPYIDMDKWGRDVMYDYYDVTPKGVFNTVYIFQN